MHALGHEPARAVLTILPDHAHVMSTDRMVYGGLRRRPVFLENLQISDRFAEVTAFNLKVSGGFCLASSAR